MRNGETFMLRWRIEIESFTEKLTVDDLSEMHESFIASQFKLLHNEICFLVRSFFSNNGSI